MRGFLALPREFFASEAWRQPREFSRAEAELDLRRRVAYGRHVSSGIPLDPGEILVSVTGLASDWDWSRSRVQRFLTECVDRGDLDPLETTNRGTVYRAYFSDTPSETPSGTPSGISGGIAKPLKTNGIDNANGTPVGTPRGTPSGTPGGTFLEEHSAGEKKSLVEEGDGDCGKLVVTIRVADEDDLCLGEEEIDELAAQYPDVYDVVYSLFEWSAERRAAPLDSRNTPRTQSDAWDLVHEFLSDAC